MNVKPWILFMTFFCCFVYAGQAQYVLEVGDQFIPINNEDVVSKKALLSADTIRVMYLAPGTKEPSQMKNVMVVTQQNGENTGAFMHPSGIFGKEVLVRIETMNDGHLLIGQYEVPGNTLRAVVKGATIRVRLGP